MYACLNGLETRADPVSLTGDLFGITALDEDFTPINQMIKYYKFGFGRTTDYVNEEIRLGRLTRREGIDLVSEYDHSCSEVYIASYCDYLGIQLSEFWLKVRESTNRTLFDVSNVGVITRKFVVGVGL